MLFMPTHSHINYGKDWGIYIKYIFNLVFLDSGDYPRHTGYFGFLRQQAAPAANAGNPQAVLNNQFDIQINH